MGNHELCELNRRLSCQFSHGVRYRWRTRESWKHMEHHHHEDTFHCAARIGLVMVPLIGLRMPLL